MAVTGRFTTAILFAAMLLHAEAAPAQYDPEWRSCTGNDDVDWDLQLWVCTALINPADGSESVARALRNRGFAWMHKDLWVVAIRDFSASIDINPRDGAPYYGRALAKQELGDKAGAQSDMAKSRSIGR